MHAFTYTSVQDSPKPPERCEPLHQELLQKVVEEEGEPFPHELISS